MRKWNGSAPFVPRLRPMAAMQLPLERIFAELTRQHMAAIRIAIFVTQNCRWTARGRAEVRTCDKAAACAVMLHLRACYVSKAAILTIPVLLVPVENRSPA